MQFNNLQFAKCLVSPSTFNCDNQHTSAKTLTKHKSILQNIYECTLIHQLFESEETVSILALERKRPDMLKVWQTVSVTDFPQMQALITTDGYHIALQFTSTSHTTGQLH